MVKGMGAHIVWVVKDFHRKEVPFMEGEEGGVDPGTFAVLSRRL